MMKLLSWLILILVLSSCTSSPKETMEISQVLIENSNDSELKVWIMYGLKLNECRKSPIYSEYDCQVGVREEAARYWGKLKVLDNAQSKYLSELEKVYLAGYIREYVWVYIIQKLGQSPENLREAVFSSWAQTNIPKHEPVVDPGIRFK